MNKQPNHFMCNLVIAHKKKNEFGAVKIDSLPFDASTALFSLDFASVEMILDAIKSNNFKPFSYSLANDYSISNAMGSPLNYLAIASGIISMPGWSNGWIGDFIVRTNNFNIGDCLFDYGITDLNRLNESSFDLLKRRHQQIFPNIFTIDDQYKTVELNKCLDYMHVESIIDDSDVIYGLKKGEEKYSLFFTPAGQYITISTSKENVAHYGSETYCGAIEKDVAQKMFDVFVENSPHPNDMFKNAKFRFFGCQSSWLEPNNTPSIALGHHPEP